MTQKELEKLPALRRRLEQIDRQINNAYVNGHIVIDTVRGKEATDQGKGRIISISGRGHDKLPEWEQEYHVKAKEYLQRIGELEAWLDSLPEETAEDIDAKTILQYKYRNGMKHREIAGLMGYSKEAVTKKLKRFWEKCTQNTQTNDV